VTTVDGDPAPVEGLGPAAVLALGPRGQRPDRLPVYEAAVASDVLPAGWAADDGVGLLFRDDRLERVVTSRPGTRAVHVARTADGALVRTPDHPGAAARRAAARARGGRRRARVPPGAAGRARARGPVTA
jgi:hypothetical protein